MTVILAEKIPSMTDLKKMCVNEGLDGKLDEKLAEKLREMYQTFAMKITRQCIIECELKQKGKLNITNDIIDKSLTQLFGASFVKKLQETEPVLKLSNFKKLFQKILRIYETSHVSISKKDMGLLELSAQHALQKSFLAPIYFWKNDDGRKLVVKMEDILHINSLYLVSGSEFFCPSVVKSDVK